MKSPRSVVDEATVTGLIVKPLWHTLKQAVRSTIKRPNTILYPIERPQYSANVRNQHAIDWDKCIGCEICRKVCPNECIYFEFDEVPKEGYEGPLRCMVDEIKRQVRRPAVDVGHCLFCGDCEEFCPTDAYHFSDDFEIADYTREDLYYHAKELMLPPDRSDKEKLLLNRMGENPILEVDICIGCRRCERECPTRCIEMVDGPNERKGKPIVIPDVDYSRCIGCAQCADVCPVNCLHMEDIPVPSSMFYHVNPPSPTEITNTLLGSALTK